MYVMWKMIHRLRKLRGKKLMKDFRLSYVEQCSTISARNFKKFHRWHGEFLEMRQQSCKQSDIRIYMPSR